jgi:hypothetical protein
MCLQGYGLSPVPAWKTVESFSVFLSIYEHETTGYELGVLGSALLVCMKTRNKENQNKTIHFYYAGIFKLRALESSSRHA